MQYSDEYGPHLLPLVAKGLMLRHLRMTAADQWLATQPQRVQRIVKAAVPAGATGNWASPLLGTDTAAMVGAFSESLRTTSLFFRLLADGALHRVPLRARVALVTAGLTAAIVSEGAAKPFGKLTLANQVLASVKVAIGLVATSELLTSADAGASRLFGDELRGAVSREVDTAFLSMISNTGSPSIPATSNCLADLKNMAAAANLRSSSKPYFIGPPSTQHLLATLAGAGGARVHPEMPISGSGELVGIPFLPTDGMSAGELALIDGFQIVAASDDIQMRASKEASVLLDDAPTNNAATPTATALVSLFQTNSVGLICEASIGAEALHPTAIVHLTGAAWGGP